MEVKQNKRKSVTALKIALICSVIIAVSAILLSAFSYTAEARNEALRLGRVKKEHAEYIKSSEPESVDSDALVFVCDGFTYRQDSSKNYIPVSDNVVNALDKEASYGKNGVYIYDWTLSPKACLLSYDVYVAEVERAKEEPATVYEVIFKRHNKYYEYIAGELVEIDARLANKEIARKDREYSYFSAWRQNVVVYGRVK